MKIGKVIRKFEEHQGKRLGTDNALLIATFYEFMQGLEQSKSEGEGKYYKLTTDRGGSHADDTKNVLYYDDLKELSDEIWVMGANSDEVVHNCEEITKKEYDENYLPI